MNPADPSTDVLVAGAGPTGQFLALLLARLGLRVRLIDRHDGPAQESRAMAVQARTLEFYRQLGLANEAVALGIPVEQAHLWAEGHEVARLPLREMGAGRSAFPFVLALAQDVHEHWLLRQLAQSGVQPEWNTELRSLRQDDAGVTARLRLPDGLERETRCAYLVGCDGPHSATRQALGIGFPGGSTEGLFYVADVEIEGDNQDLYLGLMSRRPTVMAPVRSSGMQRLIGAVPAGLTPETARFEDVGPQAARSLGVTVRRVNWFSTYHVSHRVAGQFHAGRCFLAGDAGHVHSPVGGQGLNTGLGDGMNLAWKLAAVLRGQAHPRLLESYESERMPFARELVATTDQLFEWITGRGWLAQNLRLRIAPLALKGLARLPATQRLLFGVVSQTRLHYRRSELSAGIAGEVQGGDRLPWVPELDNHAPIRGLAWQLQVYGEPSPALHALAAELGLPLHAFDADARVRRCGLAPGSAYLLRPDGYVGLAFDAREPERLRAYVRANGLRFTG